jgi:hypothetical protein
VDQRQSDGNGYFPMKMYTVRKTTATTVTTVGTPLCYENVMFCNSYIQPTVAYCGDEKEASSKLLRFDKNDEIEELLRENSI